MYRTLQFQCQHDLGPIGSGRENTNAVLEPRKVTVRFQALRDYTFLLGSSIPPSSSIDWRNRGGEYRWRAPRGRIRSSIFISIDVDILVAINIEVPLGFIFDDAGCRFGYVVQRPRFDSLSFGVVYRPWGVECFRIRYHEAKVFLQIPKNVEWTLSFGRGQRVR